MPVRQRWINSPRRPDGYRSAFEADVAADLAAHGCGRRSGLAEAVGMPTDGVWFLYEPPNRVLSYTIEGGYTPDFVLSNGVILEAKGWLSPEDKRKMRAVKAAHPQLDIRFVFQSAGRKGANLRWAAKHGFPACVGRVPEDWTR